MHLTGEGGSGKSKAPLLYQRRLPPLSPPLSRPPSTALAISLVALHGIGRQGHADDDLFFTSKNAASSCELKKSEAVGKKVEMSLIIIKQK